jgi:hypothetical protein
MAVLLTYLDSVILLVELLKFGKLAFEAFFGNLARCPFKVYSTQGTLVCSRQCIIVVPLPGIIDPIFYYIVCTTF